MQSASNDGLAICFQWKKYSTVLSYILAIKRMKKTENNKKRWKQWAPISGDYSYCLTQRYIIQRFALKY